MEFHMPEKTIAGLLEEQKKTKPQIEEIIGGFLDGDELKNAMDFVAFLRANNMNPRWSSTNSWRVTGKRSKEICNIQLGGAKGAWMSYLKTGDWVIGGLESVGREYLDAFIPFDEIRAFIWASIKPCTRCCSCGPRLNRVYAGKEVDECCGIRMVNPDAKRLEYVKKIVEANRRSVIENA